MTRSLSRALVVLGGMVLVVAASPVPADAFWGHRRTVVSTGYALPSVPAVVTTSPAPVVVGRPVFGAPAVAVPSTVTLPSVVTPLPHALPAASPAVTTYYAPQVTYAPQAGYLPPSSLPSVATAPSTATIMAPTAVPATSQPVIAAPRPTIVVPGGGMMLRRPILVVP